MCSPHSPSVPRVSTVTQPPTGPDQPQQPEQPGGDPQGTPPPPSPYGAPQQPPQQPSGDAYPAPGTPPPSYGSSPYGQPPSPYGAPQQPAGQPYGAPGAFPGGAFPAGGQQGEPSKGMAIGALVSSVLCCLPVGLVLGIVVLRRSKDGRDHGKGLAIAAIVLNTLVMIGALVLVVVAVVVGSSVRAVGDLEPGDCISAEGLRGDAESFETITVGDCSEPHDAEVLAMATLTEEAAAGGPDGDYSQLCDEAVSDDPERDAVSTSGDVALLVIYDDLEAGEKIACLALAPDGGQLDEPLVD